RRSERSRPRRAASSESYSHTTTPSPIDVRPDRQKRAATGRASTCIVPATGSWSRANAARTSSARGRAPARPAASAARAGGGARGGGRGRGGGGGRGGGRASEQHDEQQRADEAHV